MQNLKKIVSLALAILLVFTAAPLGNITLPDLSITATAAELVDSGTCGENLTWTLDSDGVLTISGTGTMTNLSNSSSYHWNDKKDNIKSVVIENGVESIGNYAFHSLKNLSEISIANTVTSIGNYAFYFCKSLTSVVIPDSVTTMGKSVFLYCDTLESITLPATVTSVAEYTFSGCKALTSVTLPTNLQSIGNYAFQNCTSLQTINLPDTVTAIGNSAFNGCSALESITLPTALTSLGTYAFDECLSLQSITVPAENTAFSSEDGVLYNKDKTTLICYPSVKNDPTFTVPDTVETISNYAFRNNTALTSVTIPSNVLKIEGSSFNKCTNLESITFCNPICSIFKNKATIPETTVIYGYAGSTAQEYAETYGRTFEALPANTPVGTIASGTCGDNLTWVLNTNFELIISGNGDMYNYAVLSAPTPWDDFTNNINSVIIKSGVTSIGSYAFRSCKNLTAIEIADSVTTIGNYAFHSCGVLTSVVLPDSITAIEKGIFGSCESLQSVVLPANLTTLTENSFNGCKALTSVTFPTNLQTIGDYAFQNCTSLQTINIPDTVTTIGISAFKDCNELESITLPTALTTLKTQVFVNCSSLQSIEIADTNTAFCTEDGVLYNKDKTVLLCYPAGKTNAEFTVPESVVEIGGYAFYNCKNLITVIVPEGSLTSIDGNAFRGCSSLASIILPVELKTISPYAFADCAALTDIYYTGSEAQWNEITIWSNGNDAVSNAEKHYNYCFHKVTEEIPAVDATCTETGLTAGIKCTKCGETLTAQTETPANGHAMGDWYVAEAATCTKAGTEQRDCANCDYFETNEITATGHTPAQAVIENEVAADCSNDGSYETVIYCSICTAELSRETTVVPADGHAMGDWYETKAATCSEAGKEQSDCANCDYFETRETAKTAHTEKEIAGYAATCTESGLTDGCVCTVCGETITAQTEIPAAGHSEKIIPGVASTCTTKGLTDGKQCTVCGETIKAQQSVGKLMHKDSDNDGECDYGCGYAFDESSESDMPDDSEESKPVGNNSLRIILRVLADIIDIFVTILKFLNRA